MMFTNDPEGQIGISSKRCMTRENICKHNNDNEKRIKERLLKRIYMVVIRSNNLLEVTKWSTEKGKM